MADGDPIVADASLAQARRTASHFRQLLTAAHTPHPAESLREAHHNGHHIVVRTTYAVTVDGQPFDAELGVSNQGQVHYHGMPNVAFASALDLMKAVVDRFSDEFEHTGHTGQEGQEGQEGGHHHGGMASRAGAPARAGRKRAAVKPAATGRKARPVKKTARARKTARAKTATRSKTAAASSRGRRR